MKDFTINGWSLRFDNGTSRIIRDARGIKEENALDGIEAWEEMAPWILFGGWNRQGEKDRDAGLVHTSVTIENAKALLDDLSPSETIKLINSYVAAMSVTTDEQKPVAVEGEEPKK